LKKPKNECKKQQTNLFWASYQEVKLSNTKIHFIRQHFLIKLFIFARPKKGKSMKITLLAFAAISLSFTSFAQQIKQDSLEEIIVSENRTDTKLSNSTRDVVVISKAQLAQSPARTIADVLEYVAGVDIRQRGPVGVQSDISIRGGSFEQTLVLINGVKMSDPQTGHHLANLPINMDDIERIEIIKGGASRIFGQNAFSGAINIITKKPVGKNITAGVVIGENNLRQFNISGNYSFKKYSQRISYSNNSSAGYQTNSDFKNNNAFYESSLAMKNAEMSINAGYQDKQFGAGKFYTEFYPWQYEETKTYFGSVGFHFQKLFNLSTKVYYRRHEDNFLLKRDTPSFSQNLHNTDVAGLELNAYYVNRLGKFSMGADLREEIIKSNNLGNHNRLIYGVYAEQQITAIKRFTIVPGVYLNSYSDYGFTLYPGIDAGYSIIKNWSINASVNRSFRVPTYTDLYYNDKGKSSIGNPNLSPEMAWNYEVNMKYRTNLFNIHVGVFYRQGTNMIDWKKDSIKDPSWKAINISNLNTYGFESHFTILPKNIWKKNPISRFEVSYTKIEAKGNTGDYVSRYVFDYLKNQLAFSLDHNWFLKLKQTWRLKYEDRITYKPYWLLDSRLSWIENHYSIFVEVSNITDVTYFDSSKYLLMPGRWGKVGVSISIGKK
jgi:vitamin B12 transporter